MPATRLILRERSGEVDVLLHYEGQLAPEPFGPPSIFVNPLTVESLEHIRFYLEDYLQLPSGHYAELGQHVDQEGLKAWGEALFSATFGADAKRREAYVRARTEAAEGRLVEVLISSNNARFLGLPWELIKDPDHPEPLALRVAGFDRTIPNDDRAIQFDAPDGLRVLMVIARPAGIQDVAYQTIARPLFAQLERVHGRVAIEVLRPPTFEALKARLAGAADSGMPFHVVHFDGHGTFGAPPERGARGFDPQHFYKVRAPKGYLCFEQKRGEGADPVAAEVFAAALRRGRVPLIILNACRSGTIASMDDAAGPEASVATRLLQEGAAAVVAMSYSVYVVAAAAFMAVLYEQLFAGKSVSHAVAAARLALRKQSLRPSLKGDLPLQDWMVPVHYARAEIALPQLAVPSQQTQATPEAFMAELLAKAKQASDNQSAEGLFENDALMPAGGMFFGRDREFYALERMIRLRRVCIIQGAAGTGKTELAKAFARWLRDSGRLDRADFVFFYSFEAEAGNVGLDDVLSDIGLKLAGSDFARAAPTTEQRVELILKALAKYRMLLIWDSFESIVSMPDPAQAMSPLSAERRAELRRFIKAVERTKSAILITSRSWETWLDDVPSIIIGGLDRRAAIAYADHLLASYPEAAARRHDHAFAELFERLEGNPLVMRELLPCLCTSDARTILAGLRGDAALPETFTISSERMTSLGASLDYSLRHLTAEERTRLTALGLVEGVTDAVTVAFFSDAEGVPSRFAGSNVESWARLILRSDALGLLSVSPPSPLFRLHPVLAPYLLARWRQEAGEAFDAEREATLRGFISAYAQIGQCLFDQMHSQDAQPALATVTAERRTMETFLGAALDRSLFEAALGIMKPLNEFWNIRDLPVEARYWVDRVRTATEPHPGKPPLVGSAAAELWVFAVASEADRHQDLNDRFAAYDGIRTLLEADPDRRRRANLAGAYHGLGVVAQARGDLDTANKWYRQGLSVAKKFGNRPGMCSLYRRLGALASDRGRLNAAEKWLRNALALCDESIPTLSVAWIYDDFGRICLLRSQPEAAEDWYERSLAIKKRFDYRSGMASTDHQLGIIAHQRGQLDVSECRYRQSLAVKEKYGSRPALATTYYSLGILALDRGRPDIAQAWGRQALTISDEVGDRRGMAGSLALLAHVAMEQGDYEYGARLAVSACAMYQDFPNEDTGMAPFLVAFFANIAGMAALEEGWRRVTGTPLPDHMRSELPKFLEMLRDKGILPATPWRSGAGLSFNGSPRDQPAHPPRSSGQKSPRT